MWVSQWSRSRKRRYLHCPTTGETKWPDRSDVAAAYDALAVPDPGAKDTSTERRRATNAFKRALVDAVVPPGGTVLDLACCRGGDLHKFRGRGVARYVGVDLSEACVAEARRRAAALPDLDASFHVADLSLERLPLKSADAVWCMFALHYLCGHREHLASLLGEVARVLAPGGPFVLTVPDHAQVRAHLAAGTSPDHMRVAGPVPPDDDALARDPWGHAYTFEFPGRTPPLREFLVFPPALEDLARDHGLDLVRRHPGAPDFYVCLEFARRKP